MIAARLNRHGSLASAEGRSQEVLTKDTESDIGCYVHQVSSDSASDSDSVGLRVTAGQALSIIAPFTMLGVSVGDEIRFLVIAGAETVGPIVMRVPGPEFGAAQWTA